MIPRQKLLNLFDHLAHHQRTCISYSLMMILRAKMFRTFYVHHIFPYFYLFDNKIDKIINIAGILFSNALAIKLAYAYSLSISAEKPETSFKPKSQNPKSLKNKAIIIVYHFQCGLCDMDYVGYTNQHLHQHVDEHSNLSSTIAKHMHDEHGTMKPNLIIQ